MFRNFNGTTADQVWQSIASAFAHELHPTRQQSRAGMTYEMLHTSISIAEPMQRWVVSRQPPINPAFAIVEVIWIISGRRDSRFLNYFNRRLPEFAGYGPTYYGAYGHRLRKGFGIDQIERAYNALKVNPDSRQVALQIWDPCTDLPDLDGKPRSDDIPCNVVSFLKIRDGKLEWMQVMRSNDLFRGLPYNIMQFTSLQEVLAGWLGVDVGSYCQISDSLHIYENDYEAVCNFVPTEAARNTDSLAFTKPESEARFEELSRRIELFIEESLSRSEHLRLCTWIEAPSAYQNILRVIGAEAARRRRWHDEAGEIMNKCTNPAFIDIWNRWISRVGEGQEGVPQLTSKRVVENI
jgi:thymidylate synthase